jgi:hypothetical protein
MLNPLARRIGAGALATATLAGGLAPAAGAATTIAPITIKPPIVCVRYPCYPSPKCPGPIRPIPGPIYATTNMIVICPLY